jgi:phosphodiesterase/alkaline phosphatase D-like protein
MQMRACATVLLVSLALVPAGAGVAAVATAPTAITGPVSAVGTTSATASGTVNPNGLSTSWYFEYGTSTSYGKKTATRSAGSGTSNVQVSATLTDLTPGTTYHYRLVAVNGDGTTRGADGVFTTSSGPVAVTGAASDVTVSSATLAGTVDPNGRSTTWYFEYGTSTAYGSKTPARSAGSGTAAVGVSAPVSGLTAGRLYHYRLVATSDAGTGRGADRTFSTAGAPAAVTGSVSSVTASAARLNGRVTPNGQATTWYFEYGTTTAYGTRTPARSAGKGTSPANVSVTVTGLRATTAYHYRLVAANPSGTSLGADRAFGTAGPAVARTGAAVAIGTTTATVTGLVNPQGRRTTWYFEYGPTVRYGARTPTKTAVTGFADQHVAAPISGLRPGTTYYYRLVARSDAGTQRGAGLRFRTIGATLTARARRVVFGRAVMLSGKVPIARAAEQVTVLARRFGRPSFSPVAVVVTDEAGFWRWLARPRIRTTYAVSWNGGSSGRLVIGVRPRVSFQRIRGQRFATRVVAARSFARRIVKLQRRTLAGRWVTLKRVRLNRRSAAVIPAPRRRGTSRLRVVISVNQAGRGYLAGISRTIVYRRS